MTIGLSSTTSGKSFWCRFPNAGSKFLRRVSLLDRFSGELCDYVLERRGSATAIRDLSRSNALLTALDRRDEWFRFHALFREMLCSELHRAEPQEEERLHRAPRSGGPSKVIGTGRSIMRSRGRHLIAPESSCGWGSPKT